MCDYLFSRITSGPKPLHVLLLDIWNYVTNAESLKVVDTDIPRLESGMFNVGLDYAKATVLDYLKPSWVVKVNNWDIFEVTVVDHKLVILDRLPRDVIDRLAKLNSAADDRLAKPQELFGSNTIFASDSARSMWGEDIIPIDPFAITPNTTRACNKYVRLPGGNYVDLTPYAMGETTTMELHGELIRLYPKDYANLVLDLITTYMKRYAGQLNTADRIAEYNSNPYLRITFEKDLEAATYPESAIKIKGKVMWHGESHVGGVIYNKPQH